MEGADQTRATSAKDSVGRFSRGCGRGKRFIEVGTARMPFDIASQASGGIQQAGTKIERTSGKLRCLSIASVSCPTSNRDSAGT